MFIVQETDLRGLAAERPHRGLVDRLGLVRIPVPLALPPLTLSLAWHARYDADPAHAWLRRCVRDAVDGILDE